MQSDVAGGVGSAEARQASAVKRLRQRRAKVSASERRANGLAPPEVCHGQGVRMVELLGLEEWLRWLAVKVKGRFVVETEVFALIILR
jgi:hypothetical protein